MPRQISAITKSILLLSILALSQLACAQSKTVSVNDPRPVAKAVQMLENIYGWPITYEDTVTVNESLLEDVTEQVRSDPDPTHDPDPSHRVIVQKGGTLSFSYKLPTPGASQGGGRPQSKAETEADVANALSSVLEGYANSRGLETFAVTEEDGVFHVFPINFLNDAGKLQQMIPILDTKITIPPKQRTRVALLQEICRSLTDSTGISVVPGMFPFNGEQPKIITTISGSDVTARSLLSKLLAEWGARYSRDVVVGLPNGPREKRNVILDKGAPMTWQLFFGPGWGYALNIHKVTLQDQ